jgi:hypothetical protein
MNEEHDGTPAQADAMYVWMSRNAQGEEGMMVAPLPGTSVMFCLAFLNEKHAREQIPFARDHADLTGDTARLVEFTRGQTLAEVSAGM